MYIAGNSVFSSVVLDLFPVILVLLPVALDLIPVKRKSTYEVFSGVFSMKLEKTSSFLINFRVSRGFSPYSNGFFTNEIGENVVLGIFRSYSMYIAVNFKFSNYLRIQCDITFQSGEKLNSIKSMIVSLGRSTGWGIKLVGVEIYISLNIKRESRQEIQDTSIRGKIFSRIDRDLARIANSGQILRICKNFEKLGTIFDKKLKM